MTVCSVDTNIIVYSLNQDCEEHEAARDFMQTLAKSDNVAIAEQTLVELYLLIRNPAVFQHPYQAEAATEVCYRLRTNPRWRIIECRSIMNQVWSLASTHQFPRRRIIDARLGLTLVAAGVTEFATRNIVDFEGLGFQRVYDPLIGT